MEATYIHVTKPGRKGPMTCLKKKKKKSYFFVTIKPNLIFFFFFFGGGGGGGGGGDNLYNNSTKKYHVIFQLWYNLFAELNFVKLIFYFAGNLDIVMLERFIRHFRSIHYTVVEPDVSTFDQFRRDAQLYESNEAIEFEWHNTTIEQFCADVKVWI